jgi:hypothetical protein
VLPRAICVSGDEELRGVVEHALAEAGVEVEHCAQVPEELEGIALLVIDRATRRVAGNALRSCRSPVVIVGDDLYDDGVIALMLEPSVSHIVCDPLDRDLGITSEKLVSGDFFGLEKYVARGSSVQQRSISSDATKRAAIGEVCAWAEACGARRSLVYRIANVVDELLMNALLDAPQTAFVENVGVLGSVERAPTLRWARDDRVLAVSVGDAYGTLRKRDVLDNVRRARRERGRPQPSGRTDGGAGLGLYLVLANVASLVVNVEPGRRTEVVCVFDLARRDRPAVESGARSLHVFSP